MWLPTAIPWVACFSDLNQQFNVTFECANLTVPVDYLATSGNLTTQIGMAKARPYGIAQPSGILFYQNRPIPNATLSLADSIGILLNMTNREYDIFLVDARGSGWSNPVDCGFSDETYRSAEQVAETKVLKDELPLSFEGISDAVQYASPIGIQNCTQNEDLHYLAHLNAPNIARDMDLVRNLSGFDTLAYYGEEYGSIIGITYASLFPNQVGHMVLDLVSDFEAWMGVRGNVLDYSFEMNSNLDDIIHQFATLCVAAYAIGSQYCLLAEPSMHSQDPVTDIVNRINAIFDYVSKTTDGILIPGEPRSATFMDLSDTANNFGRPESAWIMAKTYLDLETALRNSNQSGQIKRQVSSSSNLSFAFLEATTQNDILSLAPFSTAIINCVEANFIGINDTDSFSNYVLTQTKENPYAAYQGIWWYSMDVPCPNLTSFNPERLPIQFSPAIRNKIIITARTYQIRFPMAAAMNTYHFVGAQNAVVFVHDVFGYNMMGDGDPDDCTMNVMKAYFTEDIVPENGTVCHTDYSGMNNIFVQSYDPLPDSGKRKLKIGLSLGLGLGCLGLVSLIVSAGYWNIRRKRKDKKPGRSSVSKTNGLEIELR